MFLQLSKFIFKAHNEYCNRWMNYPFAHEKWSLLKKKSNLMFWKFLNINLARKILEKISLNWSVSQLNTNKAKRLSFLFQNTVACAFSSIDLHVDAVKSHSLSCKFTYFVKWIFHLFHSEESTAQSAFPFQMSFSSCEAVSNSKRIDFHYSDLNFCSRSPIMAKF